ncbi:unnamed protein product [Paramecium pentaurelia]|uniref:PIPK domain-containing protein n=1 Tax=Paramecium pentaurelia TaxID=43138 RepID=A0A8S1VW08_9CILI|nr:unnamed protein product [Paramecium pentaurelia]
MIYIKLTFWIVLAFSIIGILLSLFYIYIFIKIRKLHKSPGDIYFGMCLGELIMMLHYLIESIVLLMDDYYNYQKKPLCIINLVGFTFSVVLIYAYTIQLYMHMVVRLMFTLQAKKINKWQGHVATFLISMLYATISLISFQESHCGVSLSANAPFTFIILLLSFFTVAITVRQYIKREFAQNSNNKLKKQGSDFIYYITKLFIAQSILMTSFITFAMAAYILKLIDRKFNECPTISNDSSIGILRLFAQISAILYPIVIPLIRLTDPFVFKHIRKHFFGTRQPQFEGSYISLMENPFQESSIPQKKISLDGLSQSLIEQNSFQISYDEPILKKLSSQSEFQRSKTSNSNEKFKQITQQNKQEDPFIHQFTNELKRDIIKRILALILIQEKDKITEINQQQYFKKIIRHQVKQEYYEQVVFNVHQLFLKEIFEEQFENQNKKFTMISYAPVIFDILIKEDQDKLDISNCLDLEANQEHIRECAQTTGGKSGEFFFFNHNNKLLLKTITMTELNNLTEILEQYFWHCTQNPNTLIAKILGIYTFEGFEIGRISMILMKNIGKINLSAITRIFDLKGSSYKREVHKPTKQSGGLNNQIITIPKQLKDIDFIKLEKQINISPQCCTTIYEQLEIDTLFLQSLGFMDYSFCLMLVDWLNYYTSQLQDEIQDQVLIDKIINQKIARLQHCYPSTIQKGIYYHMGIIDYLQKYNLKKITEKYSKRFMKLDSNLDTSSQNPQEYRKRFLLFMKKIL